MGRAPFEGFANGIVLSGKFAYVSDESSGLRKFDIGDPAAPKFIGLYRTPGEPAGVSLHNGRLIVPDSFSLFVLR